jgi:hypothetical protein
MDEFGAPGTAGEKGLADHAAECLMTRTPSSLAFHLIHGLLILFICRVLCVKGMACPDRITVCCFDRFYSCDLGDRALTQSRTTGLRLNRCAARDGRTYYISTTTTDMHARRESCDFDDAPFRCEPAEQLARCASLLPVACMRASGTITTACASLSSMLAASPDRQDVLYGTRTTNVAPASPTRHQCMHLISCHSHCSLPSLGRGRVCLRWY